MSADEIFPAGRVLSFGGRRDSMATQDVAHRPRPLATQRIGVNCRYGKRTDSHVQGLHAAKVSMFGLKRYRESGAFTLEGRVSDLVDAFQDHVRRYHSEDVKLLRG